MKTFAREVSVFALDTTHKLKAEIYLEDQINSQTNTSNRERVPGYDTIQECGCANQR
jgi:hypothetical protein